MCVRFFLEILSIYLTEREEEAGSPLSREPDAGLDPRTPGPWPESRAEAFTHWATQAPPLGFLNFQMYHAVVLTVVITLYIVSLALFYLINENLYFSHPSSILLPHSTPHSNNHKFDPLGFDCFRGHIKVRSYNICLFFYFFYLT